MKTTILLTTIVGKLFGEYLLLRIYYAELASLKGLDKPVGSMGPISDVAEMAGSDDPEIQACAGYQRQNEAFGFGTWIDGKLAGVCWFWTGKLYKERNFWPLRPHEAKLVRVVTHERFRGRGIAPSLIAYASHEMKKQGFKRLFARVWHSYMPSRRAFEKAGWRVAAFVLELCPLGPRNRMRLVYRKPMINPLPQRRPGPSSQSGRAS